MAVEDKYNKQRYSVKILGEEIVVVGEISEEYIAKLTDYINEIGAAINNAYPRLPRRRLLGLTMINMADEFYKIKKEYLLKSGENKRLKKEKEKLEEEMAGLKQEYEDLLNLLEEVNK